PGRAASNHLGRPRAAAARRAPRRHPSRELPRRRGRLPGRDRRLRRRPPRPRPRRSPPPRGGCRLASRAAGPRTAPLTQLDPRAELVLEDEHVAVEAEDEIAREEAQARRRLEPRDLRKRAFDLRQVRGARWRRDHPGPTQTGSMTAIAPPRQ